MEIKFSQYQIVLIMTLVAGLIRILHDREKKVISIWTVLYILVSATGFSYAIYSLGIRYKFEDLMYVFALCFSIFSTDIIDLAVQKIPEITKPFFDKLSKWITKIFE